MLHFSSRLQNSFQIKTSLHANVLQKHELSRIKNSISFKLELTQDLKLALKA